MLILMAIVPLVCFVSWAWSYEIGPGAMLTVFFTALSALALWGNNMTHGGRVGMLIPLSIVAVLAAFFHELYVYGSESPTTSFKLRHPARYKRLTSKVPTWTVTKEMGDEKVHVAITNGKKTRFIGYADPVENSMVFLQTMERAHEAAATFNAEAIQ